jgi:RNA polymerase sigma factor (sigma-70 family)
MPLKNSSPAKLCTKAFAKTATLEELLALPLLTFEEEKHATVEQLFAHNTRFAIQQASFYVGHSRDDLQAFISAALQGLWKAAKKYDGDKRRQAKFIGLAKWYVRREFQLLRSSLRSGFSVSIEAERSLAQLKAGAVFGARKTKRIENIAAVCSLDPLPEGRLGRDASPDPAATFAREAMLAEVHALLNGLPKAERFVLSHRLGLAKGGDALTLHSIAAKLGVTRERVRQIEFKALQLVRRRACRAGLDQTALKLFA